MAIGVKIKDVMSKGVIVIPASKKLSEAAKLMAETNLDCLVVTDKKDVVGVITGGDIVRRVVAEGKDVSRLLVKDAMSRPVRTISPDEDIEKATEIFRDLGLKRLPVVRNQKVMGIVTETDVVKADPGIYDILKERCNLKVSAIQKSGAELYGECEECGNYSEFLKNVKGRLLCPECMDEESR